MMAAIKPGARLGFASGAILVLLGAMIYDTRIVKTGSAADARAGTFSAASYGASEFPKVQAAVEHRATDAATLASAINKDEAAAEKQYGVASDAGAEFSVKFTGTAGKQDSGVYDVAVPGVPGSIHISVQTGPAISGTDLRDATGTITFGQFSNQIDYQNAGSALNQQMKKAVLARLDTAKLSGKTISVVGVFQQGDPGDWTVTPVKLDVR